MDSFWSIMDVIFVGAGVYMLYALILMKKTGEIKTELLLSKDVNLKKCKDLEGYKCYIAPKMLIFGLGALLYGAAGLLNTYVTPLGIFYTAALVLFLADLIWFALQSKKGVQRFW